MSGTIPNDPNPALRAQLTASLAVLSPQITGLQALAAIPGISDGLLSQINAQISAKQAMFALINTVIAGFNADVTNLDALYNSGYPAMPQLTLSGQLYAELEGDEANLQAALNTFTSSAQIAPAGQLTFSPNPSPPTQVGP